MNSPISSFKLIVVNQAADNPYVEVVPDEYPDVIIRVSGKDNQESILLATTEARLRENATITELPPMFTHKEFMDDVGMSVLESLWMKTIENNYKGG